MRNENKTLGVAGHNIVESSGYVKGAEPSKHRGKAVAKI
jgi:hypothetical protein